MPRDASTSRSDGLPSASRSAAPADHTSDPSQPLASLKLTDYLTTSAEPSDHADHSSAASHDTLTVPLSSQKAREAVTKLLDGKEKEWTAVVQKRGPLTLLDLPVDILREIVKEVTHTNDLAALALTHSALHSLAIPQIYSRFDIVWPDSNAQSEPRAGVDALTYGLATLVMAEDVFKGGSTHHHPTDIHSHASSNPSSPKPLSTGGIPRSKKRRRGNYYAEFTRKFSLGNGPADWVQEYMVTKEGGKMLGTLVALAVARMRRLENFTWDMPTGILQDVWDALASLGEHSDGRGCRLDKVWVRWHNSSKVEGNYEAPAPPPRTLFTFWEPYSAGISTSVPDRYLNKRNRVERPSFSALPPLKSLSVLDIDECAYLDEMSQLIGKSQYSLRELRVGIAEHAVGCEWAFPWEGGSVNQHPRNRSVLGTSHWEKRLGGVIGILVANTFDVRHNLEITRKRNADGLGDHPAHDNYAMALLCDNMPSNFIPLLPTATEAIPETEPTTDNTKGITPKFTENFQNPNESPNSVGAQIPASNIGGNEHSSANMEPIDRKLTLEVLELERVALSTSFLITAFDWHTIRDLTILNCPGHAVLWHRLRRDFGPCYAKLGEKKPCSDGRMSERDCGRCIRLRKIHTNTVTPQLISFLKDLGPNTLEVLFLQQSLYHKSTVSIDSVMRAVRHHRGSLKKLLIDSSERDLATGEMTVEGWQKWMLNREMVHFISSGRMPKLRELGVAIDHRDWHHLLQRLPRIHHLRSLNLPFIACGEGKSIESDAARERALQIVDIVTLRPDIELCYVGVAGKCFEILETRMGRGGWKFDHGGKAHADPRDDEDDDADEDDDLDAVVAAADVDPDDDRQSAAEDDDEDEEAGENDDDDEDEDGADDEDTEDEGDSAAHGREDSDWDDDDDDDGSPGKTTVRFDVREILFYDDKVAIFKARHGRL